MWWKWLLVTLVACSSRSDRKPVAKDAAIADAPRREVGLEVMHYEQPKLPVPRQIAFELLDPGKGPRSELRYVRAPGTTTYASQTRLETRQLANSVWGPTQKLPALDDGFAITVEAPGTPLLLRPLPGTAAAKSDLADQYLAAWHAFEGRRLTVAIDDRGQLGAIVFADDPTNARSADQTDEIAQRLLATLVPLPAEPVAIGAKWRVATVLRQRPVIAKQTATYTLTGKTATGWTIAVEIRRIAEPQVIVDPAVPKGASAQLVAMLRRIDGTVAVDPHDVLPTGTLTATTTMHLRIRLGAQMTEQILDDTASIALSKHP
ncbi:MAG TPA: hypothetical protein VLX92_16505 [Kofleriaceae bacterium]|nr:hypothetical protein [Kofleriaceae bacterium]